MKNIRINFIIEVLLLLTVCQFSWAQSQLSGIKTIPGDYATIATAIEQLNNNGVGSGGVTFNVAAGYTESITAPIVLYATGTSSNPIIFQKSGTGANPLVSRTDAGSLSTSVLGGQGDAVIIISGSDFVTFDGINVSTSNQGIEYGYLLRKMSGTNGSKNVTIKNSSVTMTKGTSAFVTGIYVSNLYSYSPVNNATGVTVSSNDGRHENVSILSNTIQNVFVGIMAIGYNNFSSTSENFFDLNTIIGGSDNGNVIQNYAGNSASLSHGIYGKNQNNFTISYNTINNTSGGGSGFTNGGNGVFVDYGYNENIHHNSITLTSTDGKLHGIESRPSRGDGVISNNTITLSHNSSLEVSHIYYGQQVVPNSVTINSNTLSYGSVININQSSYMIYLNTACQSVTVSGNQSFGTSSINLTSTSAYYFMYYHVDSSINLTATETITDNTFSHFVFTVSDGGIVYYQMYGLFSYYSAKICHGNVISEITLNAGKHALFEGIYFQGNSSHLIYNNTIQTINATSNSGFTDIRGIHVAYASDIASIYSNNVSNINSKGYITGITSEAFENNINHNKVYDLSSTHTSSVVTGLSLADYGILGSSIGYVYNNFVSDLQASNSSHDDAVIGISISTPGTKYLFNNTIYLNALSSSSKFGSSGISVKNNTPLDLRNNIIVNTSVAVGTGKTTALRFDDTSLNNYSSKSDYNCFYTGTPSASNLIFYDGTNSDQTLAEFQSRVKARERHSVSEMPSFVNINSKPYDLHINPAIATRLEGGGSAISLPISLNSDFDGDIRNTELPDIGADEFTGTSIDETAPSIYFTALSETQVSTPSVNISATIVDRTGVNGSSGTRPRVYFRKQTNANVFNDNTNATDGWKFVEALNSSSPFDFTIDYSLLFGGGGVSSGDIIEYFFVAQDLSQTPYIEIQEAIPAVFPSSVNLTSSQFPLSGTFSTFTIFSEINGTITVGTGGDYTSFTSNDGLFAAINNSVVSSNVIVQVISDVMEDGTNALNQWKELPVNSNYTITIQPLDASMKTISGSYGDGLIRLNGADRVTIDGRFGGTGKYLRFTNTNSVSPNAAVIRLISSGANAGATNNTIRNCEISSASLSGFVTGIVMGNGATNLSLDNDNVKIMENNFYKLYAGIYSTGLSSGKTKNLQIIGNTIGSENESDYVTAYGIQVLQADTLTIAGNEVFNIISESSSFGIRISAGVVNGEISGNKIYSINYTGTFDRGTTGLHIITNAASSNITIANNVIYNIIGKGTNNILESNNGILVTGSTGGLNFYYNSVNLLGNSDNASKSTESAAICFGSTTSSGIDMRNNVFSNSIVNPSNTGARAYAIESFIPGSAFISLNYNDYFASGTQGRLGAITGPGVVTTISQWQSATGKDANSINEDPQFVSDFNLKPTSGSPLISAGTAISGLTMDIASVVRNTSTPTIGAYEDEAMLPVELISFAAAVVNNKVTLNWKTATEVNNYGFEIERSVVSDQPGDWEMIGFVQGNGNSNSPKEYTFVDDLLNVNADSVEYRLKQIDTDGKFEYYGTTLKVGLANISGINKENFPIEFALQQNYPNPFNPTTFIEYSVPKSEQVILKVYDILGREIETLVNEVKLPGSYRIMFNANRLTSGVYFYKMQAGKFVESKKLILIK